MSDVRLVPVSKEQRDSSEWIFDACDALNVPTNETRERIGSIADDFDAALPAAALRDRIVNPWDDHGNHDWTPAMREAFDRGVDAVLRILGIEIP